MAPPLVIEKVSALDDAHSELFFTLSDKYCHDIDRSCARIFTAVCQFLSHVMTQMKKELSLKVQLVYHLSLEKYSFELSKTIKGDYWFPSFTHSIHSSETISQIVDRCNKEALASFDTFVNHGSGWILKKVLEVKLVMGKYHPFRGGCFKDSLPAKFQKSKALVSPPGSSPSQPDCFIRAVILGLTAKSKVSNKTRWSKEENKLFKLISPQYFNFPVSLKEAVAFERNSPFSVSIFGLVDEEKKGTHIFPYYVSEKSHTSDRFHVDLLFHQDHYFTILNLGALLRKGNFKNQRQLHVCPYCLCSFQTKNEFKIHTFLCLNKTQPLKFPQKEDLPVKSFKNFKHLVFAPFVIYADLESAIAPEQWAEGSTKLKSTKQHQCIAWSTYTVCRSSPHFSSSKPVQYVGPHAIESFLEHVSREFFRIKNILTDVLVPIKMSLDDETNFAASESCELCHINFEGTKKVRDHCHLSGKFRAALCNRCNLTFAMTCLNKVVIFFHGLSNYDSHFIIQDLHTLAVRKKLSIDVIPRTSEKYLSFKVGPLQFKDSYQFLSESLATLVNNLRNKDKAAFQITRSIFPDASADEIIYRKGVFPYNYLSSLEVLKETSLPPKSEFFNDLTQEDISEEDYQFAQKIWNTCGFETLEEYLQFYLALDVLLLADVFENFRSTCQVDYGLDPVHYFSAAHYTWDAFMRHSGAEFELLTDPNMYFFCLQAIRGGVSQVGCKRKVQANNKYLPGFDAQKPSTFITDLDANNLYGRCMMDFLPVNGFAWEKVDDQLIRFILSQAADAPKGYLLEVDLSYPIGLHDVHQDYPVAPVKTQKKYKDLSPFAKQIVDKHELKNSCGSEKLMTTLEDRKNYILHYRNLQLYLRLGLRLEKVHSILSFNQAPIMREYILFNSDKRAQATNPFDTSLYKLLSNALYGKTIERADNRSIVKLITDIATYEKNVSKVTMKSSKIINPHLVALEMKHPVLKVDKPVYLGCVILELAKFYMYQFHYEVMKPHFGSRLSLLYTDTDSLIYEIETPDLYAEWEKFPPGVFDFSNYPPDHSLFSSEFKRVPGCFKDEAGGQQIEAFVGLRSKMYAFKMNDSDKTEVKVAKGVKKSVIGKSIQFSDYDHCLCNLETAEHSFHSIRSQKHTVYTYFQSKSTLSPFDDKRWILNDGITTLPYGHYQLMSCFDDDMEEVEVESVADY